MYPEVCVVKFFVLLRKSCKEIFEQLQMTYHVNALSFTTVFYCTKEFKAGQLSVFDEEISDRTREISETDWALMLLAFWDNSHGLS